ncbi:hypothetical protein Taro_031906 [Colocasia esculenta]|uniref:Uncharacterized protein n=1 Tax=Colocasia esculenta TaxID=4460 RepID=A0A843W4I5_COLES|nr:hypothetical protein [Colocasia esculenta]
MRGSPDAPRSLLSRRIEPDAMRSARHCRIGRDPPDTLKGCRFYRAFKVVLQMLVVTVVVTVVRAEEEVRVVREEEVRVVREEEVAWHSQRSNFFGVQHKIAVMVPHFGTIEGKGFHLAVKEEVNQWIPIVMTLCYQTLRG